MKLYGGKCHLCAHVEVHQTAAALDLANERMGAALAYVKRNHPEVHAEALGYVAAQTDGTGA